MSKRVSVRDAVAAAVYALEVNKVIYRDAIPEFKDGVATGKSEYLPNKQIMTSYLEEGNAIEERHLQSADEVIQYIEQTILMNALSNIKNDFLKTVSEILAKKDITYRDFGIIAWAPKLMEDGRKQQAIKEIVAAYEDTSSFIGKIGSKITVDFTLIEKKYIRSVECWSTFGKDTQGNLIFYWAKNPNKIVENGKISAKVKAHNVDARRNQAKVTTLNFVKVI